MVMRDVADRAERNRRRERGDTRPIDLLSFETLAGHRVFVPADSVEQRAGRLQTVNGGAWLTTDTVVDVQEVA